MESQKIVIYQMLPRLFGNKNTRVVLNGSRKENGCGKFNDISVKALEEIKMLGVSHIWYTGVIEHACVEGYPDHGIPDDNPLIIKGLAGSPYAIKDYYDVDPDLATDVSQRMAEFQDLLQRTHQVGLKVIIDFVPNQLARVYHSDNIIEGQVDFGVHDDVNTAFSPSNSFYYMPGEPLELSDEIKGRFPDGRYHEEIARATGNDLFTNKIGIHDWFETVKLNYGVDYQHGKRSYFEPIPETWKKMRHVLQYWAQMGVDGFRCDMVEMIPVDFWHWVIPQVREMNPWILFIAEAYSPDKYSALIKSTEKKKDDVFDCIYDKVGLYDTLRPIMRQKGSARAISDCWQRLNGLDKYMLRFLENHDEERIASNHFTGDPFTGIPAMVVAVALHQGPVMLYFGQEVGEPAIGEAGYSGDDGRTTIFDYWHVPEHQKWMNGGQFDGALLSTEQKQLRECYKQVLSLAKQPAIKEGLFYDIMWQNTNMQYLNADKIYAFVRYSKQQQLLIVCNFDVGEQVIYLRMPSPALEKLGIPRPIKVCFTDLQTKQTSCIGSEELIHNGLKLEIKPMWYTVLEIKV